MTLVKFNPEKGNRSLMPGFDDIFESILNDTFFQDRMVTRVPAVNISESNEHFHIEVAAPGLKKDDFKINMEGRVLYISTSQEAEKNNNERKYNRKEYDYNSFVRSFNLPETANVNEIEASYEQGVLCVNIAKREEAKAVNRQIEIK